MSSEFIIKVLSISSYPGCCSQPSQIYKVIHQNGNLLQYDFTEVQLTLIVGNSYKVKNAKVYENRIENVQNRSIEWQQVNKHVLLKTQIDNIKRMSVQKKKLIKKAYPRRRIMTLVEFVKNEEFICEENLQILQLLDSVQVEGLEKCAICHLDTQENLRWPNCQCRTVYHFKCLKRVDICPTCRRGL